MVALTFAAFLNQNMACLKINLQPFKKNKMKTQEKLLVKKLSLTLLIFTFIFSQKAFSQTWSTLGSGMNDWVYASAVYNGDLIVGGNFTSAGGVSANHIARWDGTNWYPLGLGVNAKVWALATFNGDLYAGGEFTEAGGKPMLGIARWNGVKWLNNLGDMNDIVTSFAVYNNTLIAGGYFIEADGLPVNNIAQYTNGHWAALGSGVVGTQGSVMALEVYNNELIAGGFFISAGGTTASHIAKWNGTTWSALGTGTSNIVYSLTNYNNNLIAGGLFSSAGGITANNIASWNGSSWSALGSGMSGILYQYVFALKTFNGDLIAGGYFTHSDGIQTNGIAKWNGSVWSTMGSGLFEPGNVCGTHTLCLYGQDLIVGGLFNTAGDAFNAKNIASWNESPCVSPTVSISAGGATVFCKGGSVLLTSSTNGSVTYQWTKNNVNISGATNATYTAIETASFTVAVSNACGNATSNAISITSNKKPDATVSPSGPVNMCFGQTIVLTANSGNNLLYQWKKGATNISGATNITYSATTGGKYKITVTNSSTGCTKNSGVTTINITCKAEPQVDGLGLQVFPNPTHGEFSLQLSDGKVYDVQISDALGRILKSYNQIEGSLSFGGDLTPGIYLLQINLNNSPVKVIKLIKTAQ